MNESIKQRRHEAIIKLLSTFEQYQDENGGSRLKVVKGTRSSHDVIDIDLNEINLAVVALTDVLNLGGGSVGSIDLYRLLQAYLLVPEYRQNFNTLVKEAISSRHK